jgi:hypothetical protein
MFDLWAPENSTLREKALEHIFLSELSKVLLLDLKVPFEVLRSEFDANGYDVVIEALGVVRHVQLKATRIGGKRRDIDVNLALATKPGGCVVWFMADPETLSIGPFLWMGGPPGQRLPVPEGQVTRHSRANAAGIKGERKALRKVPIRRFTKLDRIEDLAAAMFVRDHDQLLSEHLTARGISADGLGIPRALTWDSGAEFAMMIDGYELAAAAGLGDPFDYQARRRREAELAGEWVGSTLELWVTLFLEYRREHFEGAIGTDLPPSSPATLDALCQAFARSVVEWREKRD